MKFKNSIQTFFLASSCLIAVASSGQAHDSFEDNYMHHPDRLLIDLVSDYRQMLGVHGLSHDENSKPQNDLIYRFDLEGILNEDEMHQYFYNGKEIFFTDKTEKAIIRTLSAANNYLRSLADLIEIFRPRSTDSTMKLYRTRLSSKATQQTLKKLSVECNQGNEFTIFKPATVEMFYNAPATSFTDIFIGMASTPYRTLIDAYGFAKESGNADILKSFFNDAGFQSERCLLYKTEVFGKWKMKEERIAFVEAKIVALINGKLDALSKTDREAITKAELEASVEKQIKDLTKSERLFLKAAVNEAIQPSVPLLTVDTLKACSVSPSRSASPALSDFDDRVQLDAENKYVNTLKDHLGHLVGLTYMSFDKKTIAKLKSRDKDEQWTLAFYVDAIKEKVKSQDPKFTEFEGKTLCIFDNPEKEKTFAKSKGEKKYAKKFIGVQTLELRKEIIETLGLGLKL